MNVQICVYVFCHAVDIVLLCCGTHREKNVFSSFRLHVHRGERRLSAKVNCHFHLDWGRKFCTQKFSHAIFRRWNLLILWLESRTRATEISNGEKKKKLNNDFGIQINRVEIYGSLIVNIYFAIAISFHSAHFFGWRSLILSGKVCAKRFKKWWLSIILRHLNWSLRMANAEWYTNAFNWCQMICFASIDPIYLNGPIEGDGRSRKSGHTANECGSFVYTMNAYNVIFAVEAKRLRVHNDYRCRQTCNALIKLCSSLSPYHFGCHVGCSQTFKPMRNWFG